MSMGKREDKQQPMWVGASELPRSAGHRFYEKLNELLREAEFDRKVESVCARFYEADGTAGRPSIPPGVYFRMLFVGYFEGIESERGIAWRCADSLSLRDFLGLLPQESVPDHSSLSRIRGRLAAETYDDVFQLVLRIVANKGLLRGKVVGVDSTYLRADASMKAIVRRDTGDSYQEYLKKLCVAEGIENPTAEDARRVDRKRKGKKTSNRDWRSKTDPDARITRLKDGRTRLAYKAEHVVDMDTGAVLAAEIHPADQGDTATMLDSLESARTNTNAAQKDESDEHDDGPTDDGPNANGGTSGAAPTRPTVEVVGDKGYHKAELLHELKGKNYRTYISVPTPRGKLRWRNKGSHYVARSYYANRDRSKSEKGRALLRLRGEKIERSFAHACETGGHRRVRLRGQENVRKRYVLQLAAMNLGLVMRALVGSGTPRQAADAQEAQSALLRVFVMAIHALVAAVCAVSSPFRNTGRPGAVRAGLVAVSG
jgi:transposase